MRPLLPAIRIPTLVLRHKDESIPDHACRYLAEMIPGARYVVIPGYNHLPWVGDFEPWASALEEFVTGHTPAAAQTTEYWRLSSSPTSSARRNERHRWATVNGAPCSIASSQQCGERSSATAAVK